MEPYLITLEVTITQGGSVLLSYVDPKPPNGEHFGHSDIGVKALEEIFKRIGLGLNIPQLHEGTGKRKVRIEMFVNESRLAALGFNEVGDRATP